MTHTLGQPSGVVTEGLGFMYNGAMAVFDPRPGHAGSLAPGKSRFSALSPTIVFKDDQPFLVLGAPGATYITMGNLQVMLNVIDFGMSAEVRGRRTPFRRGVGHASNCPTASCARPNVRCWRRAIPSGGMRKAIPSPGCMRSGSPTAGMDGGADPATGGLVVAV